MALSVVSDRTIEVSNKEFLKGVFGEEWGLAHVTAFEQDPSDIPEDDRAKCWAGGHAGVKLRSFKPTENQYFTISLFNKSEEGQAVRRGSLFDACFVIVADDVREKLPMDRVEQLPAPSYKLMTSSGSEQWAWILSEPCNNRDKVDNLLEGLVERGLAPDGKDPGMKGVTRYVRLPGGSNTKAKRFVGGKPFKCYLVEWEPSRLYTIEELAAVFDIDLFRERGVDTGNAASPNSKLVLAHPIMKHVNITGYGADGWIRIDCVNAAAHTDDDPSGAAIRIMDDGSLQYQCHHGACGGERDVPKVTGGRALQILSQSIPNDNGSLVAEVNAYKTDIMVENTRLLAQKVALQSPVVDDTVAVVPEDDEDAASVFDPLRYIYLAPRDEFYDTKSGMLFKRSGLDGRYLRQFPGLKGAPKASVVFLTTMDRSISDAEHLGWKPTGIHAPTRADIIFEDEGRRMINTWRGFALTPDYGRSVSLWLDLAAYLIPDERDRAVVLDYLAFIVQKPSEKPAFCIVHRGAHRVGKDLLYTPVMRALGTHNARGVKIEEALKGWGDYLRGLRLAIIEEVDSAQDHKVANAMKTLLAPTASGKRTLNLKGGAVITQVDCMASIMMSNKRACIAIERGDKRYFVVDSWVEPQDSTYYETIDAWYRSGGGCAAVLGYLLKRDISKFNAKQLPYMTAGAAEMVDMGRYDYEQDLEMLIHDGHPPFQCDVVTAKELKTACKEHGLKGGNNGIQAAMRSMGWFKFSNITARNASGRVVKLPVMYCRGIPEDSGNAEVAEHYLKERGVDI